ncbi:YceI family protein [Flavobacterium sp.]|uniref:YceI family protein n=1 Tax=Flavobacterium sp. TaxID=239 RepID=UPI002FDA27AC
MKLSRITPNLLLVVSLFFLSLGAQSQTNYTVQPNSKLKITGTSSLHDWEMVSSAASGKAVLEVANTELKAIKSITVEMQAESLKSGKSGMDKNAYKALKTDQFKTVKFELKSAVLVKEGEWTFTGTFTIAGVSKPAVFKVLAKTVAGVTTFDGSYKCKLTDFGIKPPTALMGTVKTGDDVTFVFNVAFK